MKTNIIKHALIGSASVFITLSAFAQTNVKCTEHCCTTQAKIDKNKIPKPVTEVYYHEFPLAAYDSWYGYPSFVEENDWYGYNPNLYCKENPEYYVVDFKKDKTAQKIIYSKTGKKIATHTKTSSTLPKAVALAIGKSEYATWKLGKETEEIFKDGDTDALKVYKVEVDKGKAKHFLFYQINGTLLKDKEIKQ